MPAPKRGRRGRPKVTGDAHDRYRGFLARTLIDGAPELTPDEQVEFVALRALPVADHVCTRPTCAGSCGWRCTPNV
jgi:hypothetical protein